MPTYLIDHIRVPNDRPNEELRTYLANVKAATVPFGGKSLASGPPDRQVEGVWPGWVVLVQFPDRASAEAWYSSAEYQKILPLRLNNAICDTIFIDSTPEGRTMSDVVEQGH